MSVTVRKKGAWLCLVNGLLPLYKCTTVNPLHADDIVIALAVLFVCARAKQKDQVPYQTEAQTWGYIEKPSKGS